MTDRERFDSARRRWLDARQREHDWRIDAMLSRYGKVHPPDSWMTAGERRKLEGFHRAADRASDAMFAVLERVGGRSWTSHAPHHWIMAELTWEDATTRGALSEVPPSAYGYRECDMIAFAAAQSEV